MILPPEKAYRSLVVEMKSKRKAKKLKFHKRKEPLKMQDNTPPSRKRCPKRGSTSIKTKDQKLLWGRAAGRCSIPDCREILNLEKENGNALTLGVMAHIVAEKKNGPRGRSPLSLEERNSYSNLILLCSHCHDIIDKDVKKYKIEVLHKIKAEHELWVSEKLAAQHPNPDELVFSDFIDSIVILLQLESWIWFIDGAVRDIVPIDIYDARDILAMKLARIIWPKGKRRLRIALTNVVRAFIIYIAHYDKNAELKRGGKILGPDRSYKRYSHPEYLKREKEISKWSEENFWLLCNYVVKLNKFAEAVRRYSNPLFFKMQGKFLVVDSLGYRCNGNSYRFVPNERDINRRLKALGLVGK